MHLCLKFLCAKAFCAQWFFVQETSLWQHELSRAQKSWDELRRTSGRWEKVGQRPGEMKTVEKNLLRWHVRRDGAGWEELRWGEMMWEELTWFEIRWSVECEVHVWSVKREVWRAQCEVWRKCPLFVAFRRGRALVMFLDNNTATASHEARARAWLAHGACKFYRWERPYSMTLRQLLPRLVRALLAFWYTFYKHAHALI